jgi:hypothetical protein
MSRTLASTVASFAAAFLLVLALGGTAMAQSAATVMTDQSDYAPGTIVTITGSGWQPGETVTLQFVESPLIDTHPDLTAIADANGNIFNNQFSPDSHDINITFTLTATGNTSGLQAQTTFTDASQTTVSGSVVDDVTGAGVQGATVTIYSNSGLTTLWSGSSPNPFTTASGGTWSIAGNKGSGNLFVALTGVPSGYSATGAIPGTGGSPVPSKVSNTEIQVTNDTNGPMITGNQFLVHNTTKTETITASNATTTYSSSSQNVTLTATVTSTDGTVNSGTVTFTVKNGSTTIGTETTSGTVSGGNASGSYGLPAGTAPGTYTISATYNTAAGNADGTDATHSLTVNKATSTTTVALTSGSNPSAFGSSLTFTATVTGTGATGTVAFWDAASGATCSSLGTSTQIGSTQTLSGGTSSVSTSSLAVGAHTILACYSGDTNFTSSSGTISQTVNAAAARRGQTIVASLFLKERYTVVTLQ